jgi:hypothetical protein
MFNNKRSVTVTHKDAASNYVEHEISSNGMRVTSVQGEWFIILSRCFIVSMYSKLINGEYHD